MQEAIVNGWTELEESTFADMTAASRLSRLQAIQLWRRCRENTQKAIRIAKGQYPRVSEAVRDRLAKARAARKRANLKTETALQATIAAQ